MHPCPGNWVANGHACIMPEMPTHLVHKLNVGTVAVMRTSVLPFILIYVCIYIP